MTQPPNFPPPGVRVTNARVIGFVLVLMIVLNLAFDGFSQSGVSWWTLYKVVLASGIVIGAWFAWVRVQAKRRNEAS